MREFFISNPGAGPVMERGNTRRNARRNLGALCREIGLSAPKIQILGSGDREEGDRDDGRYTFDLQRGVRKIPVSVPGIDLDELRSGCTRLYVDGSSWSWSIAVDVARRQLLDHDGSAKRGYEASVADCDFVMRNEPRCPTCGSIKDRYSEDYETVNPPHGYVRLRCVTCTPVKRVRMLDWQNTNVTRDFVKDKALFRHGALYRVTTQLMPYVELGEHEDGRVVPYACGRWRLSCFHVPPCRLGYGHTGDCEPRWKENERTRYEWPYDGVGDRFNTDILIEVCC